MFKDFSSEMFKDFSSVSCDSIKPMLLNNFLVCRNYPWMCSTCEKAFISCHAFIFPLKFLICYYPWSLDLIKWTRNKLNKQDNEDSDIQVSFSYFLICFPDVFIAFKTYCLLKASMNFLRHLDVKLLLNLMSMIITLLSIIFLIFPFFSVLFELKYAPCPCSTSLSDLL